MIDVIIDVFKMDIEYGEWSVLESIDMNYACKYIKQFVLETHYKDGIKPSMSGAYLRVVRKLEACFLMFKRDTRFFKDNVGLSYGPKSEFQQPRTYKIDLNEFEDEIDLVEYLVTFGELYFVNERFIWEFLGT